MRRVLFIATLFVSATIWSQQLSSLYKSGEIKLIPDAEYAKNTDWNKLFTDYKKINWGEKIFGINKQIVIAPDGSIFMSLHTHHSISKFDKNGKFLKEFGQKGKKASDFKFTPNVEDILEGKYLYTSSADGRLHFFDLNGNWIKTLELKYMPLGTVPLSNGIIAILGYASAKNSYNRIISLLNFNDGKEKIIASEFEAYESDKNICIHPYNFTDKDGKVQKKGEIINISSPYMSLGFYKPRLATTANKNLVVAYPESGKVEILDNTGKIIRQFNPDIKPEAFTKEDKEKSYEKSVSVLKKLETEYKSKTTDKAYLDDFNAQCKQQLEKIRNPANYPTNLPYFSEMIVDSENNILLFRFTREQGSNKFDVYTYDSQGTKIATSSFVSDKYDLKINPSVFKFYKGSIYSVVKLKGASGNSIRLVKFDLKKN